MANEYQGEVANPIAESMEEIWALFAEDGREALDAVEEALLALETSPADNEQYVSQIARLFRALHTFKGNARMMGLSVIETLAHRAEDLAALLRDHGVPLTRDIADLLLKVHDTERAMLDHALRRRRDWEEENVKDLLKQLEATLADHLQRVAAPPEPLPDAIPQEEELLFSTEELIAPEEADQAACEVVDAALTAEVRPIDPAADAGYVRIFLELAAEEWARLRAALRAAEDGERARRVEAAIACLRRAAGRMGYAQLTALLDDLAAAAPDDSPRLAALEDAIGAELARIQESARALGVDVPFPSFFPPPPPTEGEIGALFRERCMQSVLAHLSDLRRAADELEQHARKFLLGRCDLRESESLAAESARLLRAIYQHCVFQELRQAAHATLAMEDLYIRAAQGELTAGAALLDLTRAYSAEMERATQAVCGGQPPAAAPFESLIAQAEELLYLHTASPIAQLAADALRRLDIPPEFSEMLTPENLLNVSRALRAGERFYTILADLNRDERIGEAFFEWARTGGVRLISNITVFQENRTLFDFLITAPMSLKSLRASLAQLDPGGEHFTLRECRPLSTPTPFHTPTPPYTPSPPLSPSPSLADFLDDVGALAATRATLHRIVRRLAVENPSEAVARLVRQSGGDLQRACHEVQAHFEQWNDDLGRLAQLETEIGATLGQFQETALALRSRPAAEAMETLPRLVEELARQEGKLVELTVEGGDVRLDSAALDALADALRRLTRACIVHSIEKPAQRRAMGKPAVARLVVAVRKTADRAQAVVEDDGRGLETREDADWADVRAMLHARRGRLDVTDRPGEGARCAVELPLDMVVIDGLVMRVGEVYYVAPIEAVRRIVKPDARQIVRSSAGGVPCLRLEAEDELWPILTFDDRLSPDSLLVVVDAGAQAVALAVDELIGQQQVMIQPLQARLAGAHYVQACALLGEGDVGMVLDLSRLATAAATPTPAP